SSQSRASSRSEPPCGIRRRSRPSATLSRRCAAKYGRIKFLSCRRHAETASKFRSISGIACRTRSHTPPRSAKVKLRQVLINLSNHSFVSNEPLEIKSEETIFRANRLELYDAGPILIYDGSIIRSGNVIYFDTYALP